MFWEVGKYIDLEVLGGERAESANRLSLCWQAWILNKNIWFDIV